MFNMTNQRFVKKITANHPNAPAETFLDILAVMIIYSKQRFSRVSSVFCKPAAKEPNLKS